MTQEGWGDGGPGVIALYAADATSFGGYDVKTYGTFPSAFSATVPTVPAV